MSFIFCESTLSVVAKLECASNEWAKAITFTYTQFNEWLSSIHIYHYHYSELIFVESPSIWQTFTAMLHTKLRVPISIPKSSIARMCFDVSNIIAYCIGVPFEYEYDLTNLSITEPARLVYFNSWSFWWNMMLLRCNEFIIVFYDFWFYLVDYLYSSAAWISLKLVPLLAISWPSCTNKSNKSQLLIGY